MIQATIRMMNSVCRKSCTKALTSCLVLTRPKTKKQKTKEIGKENQKTVETTQNFTKPIFLNGLSPSLLKVVLQSFIKLSLTSITRLLMKISLISR